MNHSATLPPVPADLAAYIEAVLKATPATDVDQIVFNTEWRTAQHG